MLALPRIFAIALNTYREAARARLLLGVFALSLATCAYSLVIAALSLGNEARVVADLGALSFSLYGVVVAIVLGSTSLYRELEYKTIFPILSRPIRRWEYLIGKYLGAVLTVFVFIAVDGAAVLSMLALETGQATWRVAALGVGSIGAIAIAWWRAPTQARIFVVIPWAMVMAVIAWLLANTAPVETAARDRIRRAGDLRGGHRRRRGDALRLVLLAVSHGRLHEHGLRHRSLRRHAGAHPEAGLRVGGERDWPRPGANRPEPPRLRAAAAPPARRGGRPARLGLRRLGGDRTRSSTRRCCSSVGALAFQRRDFS